MNKDQAIKIIQNVIDTAYKAGLISNAADSITLNAAWQSLLIQLSKSKENDKGEIDKSV